jgi:hypothetical protein
VLQPLVYSKFRLITPDDAALDAAELEPFPTDPDSKFRIVTLMNEPAMQAVYEDWFKGNDIEWTYWVDAVHFVVSGRAEITYWDPPNWEQENHVVAGPGSFFLTPRGCRARWHIVSDEPFRRVVLDIPNPGYVLGD